MPVGVQANGAERQPVNRGGGWFGGHPISHRTKGIGPTAARGTLDHGKRHTVGVDKTFVLQTPAEPQQLFDVVSDLSTYPDWINVVHKVEPIQPDPPDLGAGNQQATATDPTVVAGPAWWVTLQGRLGPLARSKRLRMTRSTCTPPAPGREGLVRFERQETDGRDHAEWVLEVVVKPGADSPAEAHCRLAYGGGLWSAPLETLLDQTADASERRLSDLVA